MKFAQAQRVLVAIVMVAAGLLGFVSIQSSQSAPGGNIVAMAVPLPELPVTDDPGKVVCNGSEKTAHYYHNDSPKETPRSFGTAVSHGGDDDVTPVETDAVVTELIHRLCPMEDPGQMGDEALFRALRAAVYGGDPNTPLEPGEWTLGSSEMVVHGLQRAGAKLVKIQSHPGDYSLYMEGDELGGIKIGAVKVKPRVSWYLQIEFFAGPSTVTLFLRLECGFQPDLSALHVPPALL